jgi:tRNA splicing endonuclease
MTFSTNRFFVPSVCPPGLIRRQPKLSILQSACCCDEGIGTSKPSEFNPITFNELTIKFQNTLEHSFVTVVEVVKMRPNDSDDFEILKNFCSFLVDDVK